MRTGPYDPDDGQQLRGRGAVGRRPVVIIPPCRIWRRSASQLGMRGVGRDAGHRRTRHQDHEGSKKVSGLPCITATPVGQQGPPTRCGRPRLGMAQRRPVEIQPVGSVHEAIEDGERVAAAHGGRVPCPQPRRRHRQLERRRMWGDWKRDSLSFVFVSYASSDAPKIRPVIQALIAARLKIWMCRPSTMDFSPRQIGKQFIQLDASSQASCLADDMSSSARRMARLYAFFKAHTEKGKEKGQGRVAAAHTCALILERGADVEHDSDGQGQEEADCLVIRSLHKGMQSSAVTLQ
jgi:hypothetical protein